MVDSREDRMAKSDLTEEEVSNIPSESNFTLRDNGSDDTEANQDQSLKIVEMVMSCASSGAGRDGEDGVVCKESAVADGCVADLPTELLDLSSVTKKTNFENEVQSVSVDVVMKEDTNKEVLKAWEVDKLLEQDVVGNSDNAVMRRLLRGPRYFDSPDSSWGTCYNCGEEGHSAAKCKSAKRKKPCFLCGSFIHEAKQCQKARDCFNCKQSGHVAKDCPNKRKGSFQGSDLCLKCGSHGHIMFSCTNEYSSDDLKGIQCYVCKDFGHISCANYFWNVPSEVSCHKCGQLGHTGLACNRSQGEKAGEWAPGSCYKCGQEGHFSRECKSTTKAKKRRRDMTTPKKKAFKEAKVSKGHKSAPQDLGKARKKRKLHLDENLVVSPRNVRGGWIIDDPGDFSERKNTRNRGWQSPSTPSAKKYRSPKSTMSGHASSSGSLRRYSNNSHNDKNRSPYGRRTPNSQVSRNSFQHGYTASRFGNPSTGGLSKENHWW